MSKTCLSKKNLKNSLLEIYSNKNTMCPNTEGFIYGTQKSSIKLHELSSMILESKIGILNKNRGLNKMLNIIIQDLENLVKIIENFLKSKSSGLKKYMYIVILGKKNIEKLKNFLNKIINVLKSIKDESTINLKDDLEDPIIHAITINLLGKKEEDRCKYYEKSKKLLNEILKHIFFIYISPYGLQIHETFINFADDKDLKESLLLIIRFLLSDSILGYSGTLISNLILNKIKEKVQNIAIYYLSKKDNNKEKNEVNNINIIIEEYISDVNEKIKKYKKCNKEKNKEKKCIYNTSIECKIIPIKDNNTIIGQAQQGSLFANLIIKAEFNQRDDTYFSMSFLLSDFIYNNIPSLLPEFVKNIIKSSILNKLDDSIKDYTSLNCFFYNLISYIPTGYHKIIYNSIANAMANWGLIPLNYNEAHDFFSESLSINDDNNKLKDIFKGIINVNKEYDILSANVVKKEGYDIKYYYSSQAISYTCDDPNIEKELLYSIYARINKIRFIYSKYYYSDNNKTNIYINLLPNINYKDHEYKIKLITNLKDLPNDYLICFEKNDLCSLNNIINNVYKINDSSRIKNLFFERLMNSLRKGFTINLTSISKPQNIIELNIKKLIFGDRDRIEYIIPRSHLFLNQTLEYIVISEESNLLISKKIIQNGGNYKKKNKNKIIKNKVNKNTKSKKILNK